MADEPWSDVKQHHPGGEGDLPILHGPLTAEERRIADERAAALAETEADAKYKERQLTLTESANRLASINVLFTWILAVFTAIGAAAACYQGWVANKNARSAEIAAKAAKSAADTANATLNEMRTGQGAQDTHTLAQQAVTQADQTTNLAGATKSLAQTSKDALVSVQRAFVFPAPSVATVYKPQTTELMSIELQPVWANVGETPTRHLLAHSSDFESPVEMPDTFDFSSNDLWDAGMAHVPTPIFIGPKGSAGGHTTSVPLATIEEIADKKIYLYLWGWARYNDIFPNTKRHITRYCWKISFARAGKAPSETFQFKNENCLQNNCSDDECKEQ